ncbi:hypothetical protein MSHOH_3020 [Methanosarcina horonobensis HB-1 = JCM 15518]|uniref:Uncharacterized protein n=1 Tax=Methanosarcina horonobensis HB-1 = JCM 15518 TaxID=1434110 RepID=A0A0E3SHY4_9EURY|nr:hypothetical protein MSHOH_3020 [Methanosarcina horonobensis HB-1 = JCM 15518]
MITIILFALSSGILLSSKNARKLLKVYDARLWSTALLAVTLVMILGILSELTARFLAD